MSFNFSKLRGRIVEKCGTLENFSKEMEITPTTLGKKLSGKSQWTCPEMVKACNVLDITGDEMTSYFFCRNS